MNKNFSKIFLLAFILGAAILSITGAIVALNPTLSRIAMNYAIFMFQKPVTSWDSKSFQADAFRFQPIPKK